jgi:hypothetical protein
MSTISIITRMLVRYQRRGGLSLAEAMAFKFTARDSFLHGECVANHRVVWTLAVHAIKMEAFARPSLTRAQPWDN